MADFALLESVREIPREEWNALVADESPFLEWEWLASLEEAGCVGARASWSPRPLVARERGRLVAACPLYLKGNSEGEFVFDWGWADAAQRAGIAYYPKLLVGVPFTPVSGARFLTAAGEDRPAWIRRFAAALRDLCVGNELSSVHVNFLRDDERAELEAAGFLLRSAFQYHWRNRSFASFDDYLASLTSKRRNQTRRERRELALQGVAIDALGGDALGDELFDPMFEIYRATVSANPWGRQYLNRRLFHLLRERWKHRLCFVRARVGEELVAGTVNVQKGDALYGRYWGALRPLRHLHFNVCYYAGIEHCITQGLARFEPGAGGEYKQLRGFDATATWSAHFIADERLRAGVARFLAAEREKVTDALEWYAEHSANRRQDPPADG
ncbi:MAG TPA: GNAT family N-acetyltransferase [Myxococcota bacterium]|nr:GNAT family N-acetyltransferase [Myxococcota bacterium]